MHKQQGLPQCKSHYRTLQLSNHIPWHFNTHSPDLVTCTPLPYSTVCVHTHTLVHAHTHTHTHTHLLMHTHTHTHVRAHTHKHICTHTCIHILPPPHSASYEFVQTGGSEWMFLNICKCWFGLLGSIAVTHAYTILLRQSVGMLNDCCT